MTKIQWSEKSWNPLAGCEILSPGCKNCYAMRDAHRMAGHPNPKISRKYAGTTKIVKGKPVWTGRINFSETALEQPLRRRKPTTYFVNSMSDLFHEDVPDEWIDQVFAVMALCPQHRFQVLTKRPERMRRYISGFIEDDEMRTISRFSQTLVPHQTGEAKVDQLLDLTRMLKPLPNVWLGISAENHEYANLRIPYLLETPASVRFLSCEPLLSEIRLDKLDYSQFVLDISKRVRHPFDPYLHYNCLNPTNHWQSGLSLPAIDWVIVGGESGPGARPWMSGRVGS
jgi:protein gp37